MNATVTRLSRQPGHHFFGYYDICPWNHAGTLHAALETRFHRRRPEADDVARVGVVDASGAFSELGRTGAFNLQQGAMMFWLRSARPDGDEELTYNCWDGDRLAARAVNPATGNTRLLSRALAAVSHDQTLAVGLDFARMFHCRPVVGYANSREAPIDPCPRDDGLYSVELSCGEGGLLLPISEVARRSENAGGAGPYWFNHVVFRPDDERLVFLCRATRDGGRLSSLWSVRRDGTDLRCHIPFGYWISHFVWLNDRDLLISSDITGRREFLRFNTAADTYAIAFPGLLPEDGHPALSPDGRYLVCDSYPGRPDRYARLFLLDLEREVGAEICRLYAEPVFTGDIRCDLHPRWDRTGRRVTIDSVHERDRQVYLVEPGRLRRP